MSPDSVVHLKKLGIESAGTVRKYRLGKLITKEHSIGKNAVRGEYL